MLQTHPRKQLSSRAPVPEQAGCRLSSLPADSRVRADVQCLHRSRAPCSARRDEARVSPPVMDMLYSSFMSTVGRPETHPLRGPLQSRSRPSCLCLHSQAVLLQRPCLIPSSAGASQAKELFRLSSAQSSNGVVSYVSPGQQPFLPFLWSSTEQALGVPYSISPASAGSMDTRPSSKTNAGTPTSPISLQ